MNSKEYDGQGSAVMLARSLMSTLRLSLNQLADKLQHVTYDGVYERPSERVRGGGGLGLVDHLAEFLGKDLGDITGNWDMGHKMQLAFGDVFLKDVTYKMNMRIVYKLMKKYKDGKGGLIFKERSEELLHSVLKNKGIKL